MRADAVRDAPSMALRTQYNEHSYLSSPLSVASTQFTAFNPPQQEQEGGGSIRAMMKQNFLHASPTDVM